MHMNEYVLEIITRERLAEMRAEGERSARLLAGSPASRTLAEALGSLGRRVRAAIGHSFAGVDRERTSIRGALRD